jgi:hypothetical protein
MSEVDELRRQLAWANGQLMARERADAEARIAAMAEQQKQQDDSANTERQAAVQAEIERVRRGSWVTALLKNADPNAPFDPTAFEKAIPATGWPAGDGPENYHFAGQPVHGGDTEAANTMLGKLLKELEARKI